METLALIRAFDLRISPVTESLAIEAAEARHRFPIRFGDALAKERSLPVLTLDA